MSNKIGVHALVWVGGWSEAESEKAIAATAACGYDLIEVLLLDPQSVDPVATARQLESHGIGATTSLGLGVDTDISSNDPDTVARGEALLNDALSVARDMGASYLGGVLFSAVHKYSAAATLAGRRNSVEVLARLAERAKASGITLGLEAINRYESNLINTGAQAVDFIKETGSDNIKVHLDTYHMNIEEEDPATTIRECGDLLGYFHVGESHRGYLGTGTIDFKTIFRSLIDIGYTGPITFESFSSAVVDSKLSTALGVWRNLWSDSEDLATQAKSFLDSELYAASQPE
jgi:D-psicose/D-tagatose/L-ribulose 3-epimerase